MPVRILLADDDNALRRVVQFKLRQKGYDVVAVPDGREAEKILQKENFDLLITDMKMPNMDGIELLERSRQMHPDLEVIMITAYAEIPQAVRAVKSGAADYLTKPFDDDQLFVAIDKALKLRRLEDENLQLKEQLKGRDHFKHIVGVSKPFKELMGLIEKVAPSDATILITGESGTGKEVVARMIHHHSRRRIGEFVAVNCAAIPRELIESELFGHVRGAFTGAVRDKKGKFEQADGGTIFLDEIGELETDLQAKLLRVLQERVIEPVGAENRLEVDVRVIAATNSNLEEAVKSNKFREDLYYRLNVIPVIVPSLRDRSEDIPLLVRGFLRRFSIDIPVSVDDELMAALRHHSWPGNIRELENLVERMVVLRGSDTLTIRDLPPDFLSGENRELKRVFPAVGDEILGLHDATRRLIVDALDRCGWNKSKAAELLDIPRHVLIYRMKKYDIQKESR